MSGLTLYFTQEEASVRALEAGADLLLKPADPDASLRGVREAVKKGRLTEARIEQSARKILAAKFDLGIEQQRVTPLDEIDRAVGSRKAVELANDIAEHAITLVRNDAGTLPADFSPAKRIFNLAITNGDDRAWIAQTFSGAMARAGVKMETIVLDDRSSEAEVSRCLDKAGKADLVIVSMYGRVRTGQARSVALPDPGTKVLNELIDRNAHLVGISFGNPYLLLSFPKLQTYLVAYGDMPSLQEATAGALLGKINVMGRLPISLPGMYPRGTGIQLRAH
jgi:beta-N-acetylhexosaminidase